MKAFIGGILATVVLILVALVVVDVTSAPAAPARGTCVFQDRMLLPDRCVSGCRGCPECPTASTRPYFIFWTEATACPDFCLCP